MRLLNGNKTRHSVTCSTISKKTSFFLYLMLSLRQPTAPVTCVCHVAPIRQHVWPLDVADHPLQPLLHPLRAEQMGAPLGTSHSAAFWANWLQMHHAGSELDAQRL